MTEIFEDLNRELINRFRENRGRTFANSFEEFVSKIVHAIETALAEEPGQETIRSAVFIAMQNGKTPAEWKQEYINFLELMFFDTLDNCPQLKHEFARHTYDLLRREN